jgi:hypothetical protein
MRSVAAVAIVLITPISAQWLHHATPGIPRMADGKPNLAAPAPKAADGKPDLSGLWTLTAGTGYYGNVAADLPKGGVLPWADALYRQRLEDFGKDDPWTIHCLPAGPRAIIGGGLAKIVQTPALIVILYEGLAYRQIFLDGRSLPKDPSPSWMGYSIGRWDGDTLVVESTGFNDRSWLDMGGHPHSEALRTTERYRRVNFGRMEVQVTFDDPSAYAKPWSISFNVNYSPDNELIEYVCNENEKDHSHLIGRTAEEKKVKVPVEILKQYVGVYVRGTQASQAGEALVPGRTFTITLVGDELIMDFAGTGKVPLIPMSETMFSPRLLGTYEFIKNANGVVTHFVAHSAEEAFTAYRRQ